MSLIWASNFPLTSSSPPGLVKLIPPCDSLGLPRDSHVNLLMTLTSAPVSILNFASVSLHGQDWLWLDLQTRAQMFPFPLCQ